MLLDSLPAAAVASSGASLLFGLVDWSRVGSFSRAFPLAGELQVAVPLLAWALARGPLRRRADWVVLGGDLLFTMALTARLLLPETTVSGAALFLSLKLLATALFLPWGTGFQLASSVYSLLLFGGFLLMRPVPLDPAAGLHQVLGPITAAILSSAGVASSERVRQALFRRDRELEREVGVASALAYVGQALMAPLKKKDLLRRLCEVTVEVLDCDTSQVLLWEPSEDAFVLAAGHGYTPEEWETVRVLKIDRGTIAAEIGDSEPKGVRQLATNRLAGPGWRSIADEFGITVALGMTLRLGSAVLGCHSACYRRRRHGFSARQERIAGGIARIAVLALEKARLFEEVEDGSRIKSEFVATISHELRSPLSVIMGYGDLLLDDAFGPLSAEQRQPVERIGASAHELHELITSTLDLSRIEAGSLQLEVEEVEVAEIVRRLAEETHEIRQKPGLRFSWQIAPDLPALRTDPLKLKVVLKNLVVNAIKFTEEGSVTVEARRHEDGVEFAVVDTGAGIPADALARIFEAFRQEGESRGRRAGVGLGLYIVRRLVDLLGGTVRVESEIGQGSTFRVWIPRRHESGSAQSAA
jgi:signal transduction histidine kinase